MSQHLNAIALLVRDYDEAVAWFGSVLGFVLIEDTPLSPTRRWVVMSPPGAPQTRLLLARADGARQQAAVGAQAGGRVWLFLESRNFMRDHAAMLARGVRFLEPPRHEAYGTVAVFEDLYGNRWDLIEPRRPTPQLRLALFEPDIAPNAGTLLRTAACLGLGADIIEPCGFPFSDKAFRRAGMDYLDRVAVQRHVTFAAFDDWRRTQRRRLVLVETDGPLDYTDFAFRPDDVLMLGRESAGTPPHVAARCDAVVRIAMVAGVRSLNVAIAGAMVVGEALRQTGGIRTPDTGAVPA